MGSEMCIRDRYEKKGLIITDTLKVDSSGLGSGQSHVGNHTSRLTFGQRYFVLTKTLQFLTTPIHFEAVRDVHFSLERPRAASIRSPEHPAPYVSSFASMA